MKMGGIAKNKSEKRREQILDAGLALALRNGLRGTSMEALAGEAQIAKPTLYSYFPNKDAVFVAIARRIFDQLRQQVNLNLSGKGDLPFRIASALAAKHKLIFSLLDGSPHSQEIYSEKSKIAGKEVAEFEDWLQKKISQALTQSGIKSSQNYAQLLIACANGIAQKAQRQQEIGPAIRLVTNKLLA